ncbi:hypothetical protein D7M11_28145 [Paenibacillus ginsengarvi]|uniref:Uncharacterized protein n=1 Tax=Paenibacillus ginsengarvi TaxID=400777 RepID=A0A3B0BKI0_9BACL|nr:hypothetical protein D7M11_28145 [Paenibacillus ginsengarvi]
MYIRLESLQPASPKKVRAPKAIRKPVPERAAVNPLPTASAARKEIAISYDSMQTLRPAG